MSVSVVVPWRAGCSWRERALRWVSRRLLQEHPDWSIVLGRSAPGPFSRTQAILDGMARTRARVLVVMDGDVWCDPAPAVDQVDEAGWAIPHRLIHRLSAPSTDLLLAAPWTNWRRLPLSTENRQDSRPYVGHPTGTLVVLTRDVFETAPPDPRFAGWGQEDDAWACALRTLVGRPWRGHADLVHLWHPSQPRQNRRVGNQANLALYRRYRGARGRPVAMRALIDEARFPAEIAGR